jgi:hypothetical protein
MGCDGLRGGLLQRVIGEQPSRRVLEFRGRAPAQQRGLDEHRCPVTESRSDSGNVGDARRIRQFMTRNIAERCGPGLATQIADRVEVELYDGLTPVTMTL